MSLINSVKCDAPKIMVVGAHDQIIQSILDFDFVSGKNSPSITTLIDGSKKTYKSFFGDQEILIPAYTTIALAKEAGAEANLLLNLSSANSISKVVSDFFKFYPEAYGGHIFAEGVREYDAVEIITSLPNTTIAGPSGVGLLIPGILKLGAIGGILSGNISRLASSRGNTAIICSSGGMVNELTNWLLDCGGAPSFSVSYGGDSFPITSPAAWCLEAENDTNTDTIIYFGELGGEDEHDIATLIKSGLITKPIHAYIAGHYDSGERLIQFGHAKALVNSSNETALEKLSALKRVGAVTYDSYELFCHAIAKLNHRVETIENHRTWSIPSQPQTKSIFTTAFDRGKSTDPFIKHALCTLLCKKEVSSTLVHFTEMTFSTLIDHGAEPSGAVNTMITARAGRDMSSALAAGILTIGDRFGGAINNAAKNWYHAVKQNLAVPDMLSDFKVKSTPVPGIGHKKYSIYKNDPRVEELLRYANQSLTNLRHVKYAQLTEGLTTTKKPNLILNIDGAVAAILLDILEEHENLTAVEIKDLLEAEFFNSFFIIPRTVGLIAHFLSQKRLDEGLFRLQENQVFYY